MEKNSSTSSFKDLQRFLLRIALPVLAVVVIFCYVFDGWFFRNIISQNSTSGAAKIQRMFTELHPEEIPILGSSRAAGSYLPSAIHPDCWNYGIEKTQFSMLEIFLDQELAKEKSAPLIVNFDYELFQSWFCNPAHLIPHVSKPEIREYMGEKFHWTYRIPTIRYFGHFDNYIKNNLATRSTKNLIDHGGFFLKDPFRPAAFKRLVEKRSETTQRWRVNREWDERLFELLRSAPDRKVHFVVAPYHDSYFVDFPNLADGKAYLNKLSALPNVEVHDFGKVDYPDSLWKNTTHLNLDGARRFSEELRADLGW